MQPMLDPKRDLAGATPETLARALFRPLRGRLEPEEATQEHQERSYAAPAAGSAIQHDNTREGC